MAQNNNPPTAPTLQSILGQAVQPNLPQPAQAQAQVWHPPAGMQHGVLAGGVGNIVLGGAGLINGNIPTGNTALTPVVSPWEFRGEFPTHLFTQGVPLFTGLVLRVSDVIHFVINMWITCEEPDLSTYGVLIAKGLGVNQATFEPHPDNLVLLFNSESARDQFTAWLGKYTARFSKDEWMKGYFPGMTVGHYMSGYTYPADTARANDVRRSNRLYHGIYEEWVREWQWIVNHTFSKVIHINGYWLFENESEMIMFKMRDKE